MANRLYFLSEENLNDFPRVLKENLKGIFPPTAVVLVKLHMGEGAHHFDLTLTKQAVKVLKELGTKPFLFDSVVKYRGKRDTVNKYQITARENGFSETEVGCPVVISDSFITIMGEYIPVEVIKEVAEAEYMLVLSHFKGHSCTGGAGAIKNLGMGCVSNTTKGVMHNTGTPRMIGDCDGCGLCAEICAMKAITIKDRAVFDLDKCAGCGACTENCPQKCLEYCEIPFELALCDGTNQVLKTFAKDKIYFVNELRNITRFCDCYKNPGKPLIDNIGVLLGKDVVAMDRASIDIINQKAGRDLFKEVNFKNSYQQIECCKKLGMGEGEYFI